MASAKEMFPAQTNRKSCSLNKIKLISLPYFRASMASGLYPDIEMKTPMVPTNFPSTFPLNA